MRNNIVRAALDELAGRHLCDDCADTFLAILDRIRDQRDDQAASVVPLPRSPTVPISASMLADLRATIRPTEPLSRA